MNKIKINIGIDFDKYHLFYKKKHILEAKNLKELKKLVKTNITNPQKEKKVFIVYFVIDDDSKYPIKLSCSQYTISTNSVLIMKSEDSSQTILWNKQNLLDPGLKMSYINKIFDAFKNNSISFADFGVGICDIIKCKK
jgi:hypothetical protein